MHNWHHNFMYVAKSSELLLLWSTWLLVHWFVNSSFIWLWLKAKLCSLIYSKSMTVAGISCNCLRITSEINAEFFCIFTQLHQFSNTKRVFGYTLNEFCTLILACFVVKRYFSNYMNNISYKSSTIIVKWLI